ncbi:MAG TPA: CHAD domain-containing protein [Terriglobales bacterium]|jgi:CHAD domain-containing protein
MPLDSRKLQSRVNKLRKSLNKFPKNPTVEQVHDLRTRTRRVESILHGLELDRSSNETTLLDELKPIRSRAGKVRDMDVLTAHIVRLGLKDDPDCVVRLVHHLGLERGRHATKLHAGVQRTRRMCARA